MSDEYNNKLIEVENDNIDRDRVRDDILDEIWVRLNELSTEELLALRARIFPENGGEDGLPLLEKNNKNLL